MFSSVHGLIATGGLIFWGLVLAEFVLLFRCMADSYGVESYSEEDTYGPTGSGIAATISLGVLGVILFIFGDWSVAETFASLRSNLSWLAYGVGIYLAIGIPWSIFQAWFAARMRGEPYRVAKVDWLRDNGVDSGDSVPDAMLAQWQAFVQNDVRLYRISQTPAFSKQKSRICRTLAYWPMSMGYFFLADMFSQAFKAICLRLRDVYQRVINAAYKDIREDFRAAPVPEVTPED